MIAVILDPARHGRPRIGGTATFAVTQFGAAGTTGSPIHPGDAMPCRRHSSRAGNHRSLRPTVNVRRFDARLSHSLQPVRNSGFGGGLLAEHYGCPAGPLGFLTIWPADSVRPLASTLNSPGGDIVANAAIVPAGNNGAISVFATNNTDLVIDVNGYFAPADFTPPPGSSSLAFFTAVPCRVADTRSRPGNIRSSLWPTDPDWRDQP